MSQPEPNQADPSPQDFPTVARTARPRRRFRLNRKAAAALLAVAAVAGLGYLVAIRVVNQSVRTQLLAGAQAATKAGNVDQAIRNLQRYLDTHPVDIPVLEELALITAGSARGADEASAAASINDRLLRLDPEGPGRQETRRRLVDLYVRIGEWHRASAVYRLAPESAAHDLKFRVAEAIARDLIRRGEARPAEARASDHRLLAMALEGLAVPGDVAALKNSLAEYDRALKADPRDTVAAERLARLYQERLNDPARGEKVLDDLVAALPSSHQVRLIRYRYFLKLHRNDRADVELQQATRLAGSDLEVRLTAATDALRRGDGPGALLHLDAIPTASQSDLRVQVIRGMVNFNEERPEEAIDGWRQGLLSIGGTDSDLTWWLAHALLQMGRIAEARPLVAQFRRLSGDETQPLYRVLQAELDEKTGRPTRAILALEWARDRVGDYWQAMVQMALGRCYEAIWDETRALAAYRRAYQIDPRLSDPRIAAARLLRAKPDDAILEIERGLSQAPADPTLRNALAETRFRQQAARPAGDRSWTEFDRAMAQALASSPNSSSLLLMQSDRLALAGDLVGATSLVAKGTEKAPRNAALWTTWAEGLHRAGRTGEALKVLERASAPSAAGDRAPIRIARARLLLSQGRGREARDLLVRGEEALPTADRPMLWEALGRLDIVLGDVAGARAAFAGWARILPDDPRPRLALLDLAETVGDDATIRANVAVLREIGGPEDIAWRLSRAQELIRARTASDQPLSRRDPRLDEASRLLDTVLVDAPEIPAAHLLRGQVLERLGKPDEAIAAYRRAWDRGATSALPRLVDLLTSRRRFDELAGLKGKVPALRLDQLSAVASFRAGDIESANRFVGQAGQDGEQSPGTLAWQARMLDSIGKRDQAEAVLRTLAEQKATEIEPWFALIRMQTRHGKSPEAAATINRGLSLVRPELRALAEARFRSAADDRPAADRAFRAAILERPRDLAILSAASSYFEETGRKDEAAAVLKAAREVAPKERAALQQEAVLLAADPRTWDEAVKLIGATPSAEDAPADRLARALIFARAADPGRKAQAVGFLESLVDDLPAGNSIATAARVHLTHILLDAGQADRASDVALVAAQSGTDPEAIALYCESLLRAKKLPEAIRQIERLEAVKPGDPTAAGYRVRWVRESSGPGGAAKALERAVGESGDRPEAEAFGRAAFASIVSRDAKALDEAERVGKVIAGIRPSASWMRGKVLARRGRVAEALDACRPAIESDSDEDRRGAAEVATDLALAPEVTTADMARAAAIVETALKRAPMDYPILVMAAMLRHAQTRYEEEAGLYRLALQIHPGDTLSSNNLAWVLSEGLGRPKEALPLLDDVIRRKGRLGWILDTRGVVLTRLGRPDEAIQDLKEAGGESPSPSTLFHLARASLKANREQDYQKFRDKARRSGIDPKDVDVAERSEMATFISP